MLWHMGTVIDHNIKAGDFSMKFLPEFAITLISNEYLYMIRLVREAVPPKY